VEARGGAHLSPGTFPDPPHALLPTRVYKKSLYQLREYTSIQYTGETARYLLWLLIEITLYNLYSIRKSHVEYFHRGYYERFIMNILARIRNTVIFKLG